MIDYPGQLYNFLGLPAQESEYANSRFVVMPVPYEQTTTYRRGTASGPQAIIQASHEVELFDEETGSEAYLKGIHTLPDLEITSAGPQEMVKRIEQAAEPLISDGKTVCMLGGEHSISTGLVAACKKEYSDLSVIQLDAHADLRDQYQDNPHSHACVMRRIREIVDNTVAVGIRNMSKAESDLIERENLPVYHARQIRREGDWIKDAIARLNDNVYLTIDLDFFDPSIMPAVGTPEPGGGLWYPTLAFLYELSSSKNIVAFDVVELCPIAGNNVSEFTAARLIYKIMTYLANA